MGVLAVPRFAAAAGRQGGVRSRSRGKRALIPRSRTPGLAPACCTKTVTFPRPPANDAASQGSEHHACLRMRITLADAPCHASACFRPNQESLSSPRAAFRFPLSQPALVQHPQRQPPFHPSRSQHRARPLEANLSRPKASIAAARFITRIILAPITPARKSPAGCSSRRLTRGPFRATRRPSRTATASVHREM